jgi:hypothetical protein
MIGHGLFAAVPRSSHRRMTRTEMRLLKNLCIISLCSATATAAVAQTPCINNSTTPTTSVSCQQTVIATATINAVAALTISGGLVTTLTPPKASDFQTTAGVTSPGPTVTVKSNTGYTLTAAPVGNWSGPAGTSKSASDLKMKVGTGALVALGQVGTSSTATSGTAYDISYNTIYRWAFDKPGVYQLVVNYTLTSP